MTYGLSQDMDTNKGPVPKLLFLYHLCVYPLTNNNNNNVQGSFMEQSFPLLPSIIDCLMLLLQFIYIKASYCLTIPTNTVKVQ